ncbi:MAG: DUF885 domain-containing protein [Candidatus Bathyarchaeia archaeon]|nr:DUF885 domain-containing protein [Candidatus Bathyarchaeota archaeon]
MSDTDFDRLAKSMFETFLRRDPIFATSIGIHIYDDVLPSGTLQSKYEDIIIMKSYLKKFEELSNNTLIKEKMFDQDLAIDSLKLSLFLEDELRLWSSSPEAPDIVGTSLFLLLTRDFTSINERLESMTGRIDQIPDFLNESKQRITDPVKLWIRLAIHATEGLPYLLDEIIVHAKNVNYNNLQKLNQSSKDAKITINNYKEWLEKILLNAREDFAIGKDKLDKILQLRGLGLSSNEILNFAYSALEEEKSRLTELSYKIKLGASIEEVKKIIKSKHPKNFKEVLDVYRKSIEDAKHYILEKKVFKIPANENVVVKETPQFMRHLVSTAAIFQPAKFDKDQLSLYLITPHNDTKFLEEHNYYSIPNTTVHEAYPGHHLQGCCANENPSLIRLLTPFAAEFVEGWAHYCEEYMKNIGFDNSSESRFEQTIGMIWRAARMILDIKLASGDISFDGAVNYLIEQTGMDKQVAFIEVNEYAEKPTYFLSYYLGKQMILKLKRDLMKQLGNNFNENKFHDVLLNAGNIPMRYVKRAVQESFDIKLDDRLL